MSSILSFTLNAVRCALIPLPPFPVFPATEQPTTEEKTGQVLEEVKKDLSELGNKLARLEAELKLSDRTSDSGMPEQETESSSSKASNGGSSNPSTPVEPGELHFVNGPATLDPEPPTKQPDEEATPPKTLHFIGGNADLVQGGPAPTITLRFVGDVSDRVPEPLSKVDKLMAAYRESVPKHTVQAPETDQQVDALLARFK